MGPQERLIGSFFLYIELPGESQAVPRAPQAPPRHLPELPRHLPGTSQSSPGTSQAPPRAPLRRKGVFFGSAPE